MIRVMASGKSSPLLKFLFRREHGVISVGENCLTNLNQAQVIAEDKSAIPDINKVGMVVITLCKHTL